MEEEHAAQLLAKEASAYSEALSLPNDAMAGFVNAKEVDEGVLLEYQHFHKMNKGSITYNAGGKRAVQPTTTLTNQLN
jgi:hypothetical protein